MGPACAWLVEPPAALVAMSLFAAVSTWSMVDAPLRPTDAPVRGAVT